ncbi:hypothetical protein ATO12_13560 [Aquimarina atlantica]|uniref:Uncharacterized protein n=1 Tax=Aquimarina atlantica TaxID=1317122 RepID=A0A023BVA3_9FLAO|nr:hypothetical protein [Aquimarina atlantica]EZH73905.1 hypothetical protein ATO12_13560 [Aquimarina atlantica]
MKNIKKYKEKMKEIAFPIDVLNVKVYSKKSLIPKEKKQFYSSISRAYWEYVTIPNKKIL